MRSSLHRLLVTALVVALVGGASAAAVAASADGSAKVVPKGKMTLAWHVGIATRWLDPQEHDGTATPDNFTTAIHDALIKNQGTVLYDHPALAERYEFAQDATSATFWLRKGVKFHNGEPVTPEDVKFTYENYRGAKADVLKGMTERVEIIDDRTVRFVFKGPFLDFPLIFGTANVSGAGWVVPAKYYQQVGPDAFKQKPIGAGPYKLVRQEPGSKLELEAFEDYYRPVHVKQFTIVSVPEGATRVAMLERGEVLWLDELLRSRESLHRERLRAVARHADEGEVGGAAAHVHHHVPERLVDGESRPDGGGHGLVDQVGVGGARPAGRLLDRPTQAGPVLGHREAELLARLAEVLQRARQVPVLLEHVRHRHFLSLGECVGRVAVRAAKVASGQPHKDARQAGKRAFALDAQINFVNDERIGHWAAV